MGTSEKMMYNWNSIPWRKLEKSVFGLQRRIYQASCRNDRKAVHKLQRLLICSRSATLLAVRRVAQDNQGKKTAGIDGLASLSNKKKLELAYRIMSNPLISKAKPVRRVWIPKPGKEHPWKKMNKRFMVILFLVFGRWIDYEDKIFGVMDSNNKLQEYRH